MSFLILILIGVCFIDNSISILLEKFQQAIVMINLVAVSQFSSCIHLYFQAFFCNKINQKWFFKVSFDIF